MKVGQFFSCNKITKIKYDIVYENFFKKSHCYELL